MGVQGLTTFIDGNKYFMQDVKFRDSRLLIDGCSLYFALYFKQGLDQQHGGDYDTFYALLTQFFSALAACNIQPFVVLDGGMDPSEKKFATICQRLQSKIKEADSISHSRNGSVLPLLTKEVFIQVLTQTGVPLAQCPSEADWEIACLARQWNCPLLSNDSDFYIFDLPGGYLPFNHFQWTNVSGKAKPFISARRYTTSALCRWFGGLNKDLLPLCAVLSGNDYGIPKEAQQLLYLIDVNITERGGAKGKGRTPSASRIEGLLVWLSSFSGQAEALAEVSRLVQEDAGHTRNKKRGAVSSKLWACMQEYNIARQSPLALLFSEREKDLPQGWTPSGLPECLAKSAARGLLAASVVDALVMQRVMLMAQVENAKLPSSHCSAKSIRQFMYGILLQRNQTRLTQGKSGGQGTSCMRVGSEGKCIRGGLGQGGGGRGQTLPVPQNGAAVHGAGSIYVEEYDRMDLNLKKNQVEACLLKKPMALDAVGQASQAVRTGVLLEVLGVTESALSPVPLHWRLAVAVTVFWQREAKPKPTQHQLHALLMGFVFGELNLRHTGSQQNWAQERDLCAAMARQRMRPGVRRGLDLQDAHSYSQWQACLWAALCLNQLLLQPIPEPYLPWCFSGTLVHGLVKYLKGQAPESLLHKSSSSQHLYSTLLDAVSKCIANARPASSTSGTGRRRGRRKKKQNSAPGAATGRGNRAAEEIGNRFALLMSEEDDE